MDLQDTIGSQSKRTGTQDRNNPDRFFHVMNQGWYAFTREGIVGPYITKERTVEFLNEQIASQISEKEKESWRHNRT